MTVVLLMDISRKHGFPLLSYLFHGHETLKFVVEIVYLVLFLFQLIYMVQIKL